MKSSTHYSKVELPMVTHTGWIKLANAFTWTNQDFKPRKARKPRCKDKR